MNQRLNEILAPARAIVNPLTPTHADIPVFPPDAKSMRTYYLYETGKVSQRKPAGCSTRIIGTTRAETTEAARNQFKFRSDVVVF